MTEELNLRTPEELMGYLNKNPGLWSKIVVIRMTLRTIPMVYQGMKSTNNKIWKVKGDDLVKSVFRACYLSLTSLKFLSHNIISAAANDAARAAADAAADARAADTDARAALNARAAAAGDGYGYAIAAAYDADADADTRPDIIWKHIVNDVIWLKAQDKNGDSNQAAKLSEQPLWHGNAPQSIQEYWQNFKDSSFTAEHRFQPWIRWYEAVSPFDAQTSVRDLFSDTLTQRIATQSNNWWKRSALEVNTDIDRWLAEEEAARKDSPTPLTQLTEALDQLPSQQPAPYLFDWRDGRMEVLPPEPLPEDGGIAQDFLDETREKADSLFERLERTNTDPDIRRKIGKLLDVLTERVADLRPALLKSRSLSITALADAHNTPQDERELSAGVLADLIDLDLTAKELCASLPDLARQDIERLVDAMASVEDAETARSGLDAIRRSAEEAEILGPAAQAALAGLSEDAAEPAAPALKKRRVALLMATVRNLLLKALRVPGMAVKAAAGALWRFMKDSGKEFRGLLVKGTAYSLLVAAGTAPIYFVATQTEAISVVARYAEGFKDIEQILKLAGRLKTPPE